MRDALTLKKPADRIAEVTVWDVLSLSFEEGKQPGDFAKGQRYLVSVSFIYFSW